MGSALRPPGPDAIEWPGRARGAQGRSGGLPGALDAVGLVPGAEGLSAYAPSDATIDLETIATYFACQEADPDGAVRHAIVNAEIEGAVVSDALREKLGAVAEGKLSANELVRGLVRSHGRD